MWLQVPDGMRDVPREGSLQPDEKGTASAMADIYSKQMWQRREALCGLLRSNPTDMHDHLAAAL
jgi:hypothetical protein